MADRYFDETLKAWVTILPSGRAKGAHTVSNMRPVNAYGWSAGKSAAAAKHPPKHRAGPRTAPATDADVPAMWPPLEDKGLQARLLRADAYTRTRSIVTTIEVGTAGVKGEPKPLGKAARHQVGQQLAKYLELRGRLHRRTDGRFLVRKDGR